MKQFKFPYSRFLLPLMCVAFIIALTTMVLMQVPADSFMAAQSTQFLIMMGMIAVLVVVLSIWSFLRDANMLVFLCAMGLLLSIGSAYQFLFDHYTKYCLSMVLMLGAAFFTYHVWHRMNTLSDRMFWVCAGLVVVLLVINSLFGKLYYGARMAVHLGSMTFHPSEYVKVLLILLGASSFRNPRRTWVFCSLCLITCAVQILRIKDLGGMLVVFSIFALMTYLLLDDRRLSVAIILFAVVGAIIAINVVDVARIRVGNWFHAMNPGDATYQQRSYITAILFGGFSGLGLDQASWMTSIFAAEHDGALAGILAVYGFPLFCITICAYAMLVAMPAYHRSIHPTSYLILAQTSLYVFMHVVLNLGSIDIVPFTGLCAPGGISEGMNACLAFGLLIGLCAAALHPKVPYYYSKE